jgi:hypothetical protein
MSIMVKENLPSVGDRKHSALAIDNTLETLDTFKDDCPSMFLGDRSTEITRYFL